ncbi:MAG: efflux RND transporter periplasmic adaptor subunit [Deltaproteobacteria bacterium]|nr:MAG: efflux RND transporter periplasmic adaptor subunit [Deltaproteobacteria bacterium]
MENEELEILRIDREEEFEAQNQKWKKFFIVLFVLLILAGCLFLLHRIGLIGGKPKVVIATVSRIYPSELFSAFHASGYVVAQRKAALSSKITGRLAYLGVEEGSRVKKGEVIAILEKDDLEAAVERAKANVEAAKSKLNFDLAEEKDARKEYLRYKRLVKKDVASQSAYDRVVARYQKAVAAVQTDRFQIEAAKAALEEARVALQYAYIRAPFDGIVLRKFADIGEAVAPFGSATNAKAAVVTLADIHSMMVEADVAESNISNVRPDQPCEIQLDAIPNKRFPGKVHVIVPTADRAKATITVKVKFLKFDPRIMPEMSARVNFLTKPLSPEESRPRLAIPERALLKSVPVPAVFKVIRNRLQKTQIKTGKSLKDYVEVLEGLRVGDKIVLNPGNKLKDGQKVKIAEF